VRVVDPDPKTEEMKIQQAGQEREERELAADAETGAAADSHRRRADKARYLREKLERREEAERRAAQED
jgi:hypothetical protein